MNTQFNSGVTQVRVQASPFNPDHGHGMLALEARGWRCFLRRSGNLATWILKRGASAVMLVQSNVEQVQTLALDNADAQELCSLFVQAGIARPA